MSDTGLSKLTKSPVSVRPGFPYEPGHSPTGVEYELNLPTGEVEVIRNPIDQPIEIEETVHVRYRFLWGARPGAWNDEGATWEEPM